MDVLLSVILVLITITTVLLVAIGVIFFIVGQTVHKDMTINNSGVKEWGYGSFRDFQRELQSREIRRDPMWDTSLFGDGIYIHAGIIRFDNKGMVLRGLSYLRFLLFMRAQRKVAQNLRKNLWRRPDIKSVSRD